MNDGSVKFISDVGGLQENIALRHSPVIQSKKEFESIRFVQKPKQVPIKQANADQTITAEKKMSRVSSVGDYLAPMDSQVEMPVVYD